MVPVALTYLSDATPLLSASATRAAGAVQLPADFTFVSGALRLQVAGSTSGPLPCDGCAAQLTVPLSEQASSKYSYMCAHVVNGQAYLDTAVTVPGSARTLGGSSVLDCSVSQPGTYVAGRTLRPSSGLLQGAPEAQSGTQSGQQQGKAGLNVPAVVGGVVGGVAGAALVAGVALILMKRR